MKKLLCVLLVLLLALPCLSALAEPRYPMVTFPVTDAAAVLSTQTVDDLRGFNELLKDEAHDDFALMVVTVDFLDGTPGQEYANTLASRAGLSHGLLLLMAVGEDNYFLSAAEQTLLISPAAVSKVLSQRFEPLFMQQRYDEAIAAFIPAFCDEVNKAYGSRISIAGLFGTEAAPIVTAEPAAKWQQIADSYNAGRASVWNADAWAERLDSMDRDDRGRGIGLGGVILIVFLLTRLFGRKGRRRRERHPFRTLLAGLGLLSLIRRFFRHGI